MFGIATRRQEDGDRVKKARCSDERKKSPYV